jgi:hypothetical protein
VQIREGKDKPKWLRVDFWTELINHMKAKSKFMSDIAYGHLTTDGPAPITLIHVGVELVSMSVYMLYGFVYQLWVFHI